MKVWVIGHPEAIQGFSLVGVHGIIAETMQSMNLALDAALADKDAGIVLVTDDSAELVRDRIDQLKQRAETPIFLEIPDPNGMNPERMTLTEVANQAIGIRR
jgi:V/A-type H+-transporting ATPase subunit F